MQHFAIERLVGRIAQKRVHATAGTGFRRAAVLVLLYEADDQIWTVYIQRSRLFLENGEEAVHSGQIAFPGGKVEPNEEPLAAALREAEEEVGLDTQTVRVLGELGSFVTLASKFLTRAYAGWSQIKPILHPNADEVAAIFHISLDALLRQHKRGLNFDSMTDRLALHYHCRPASCPHDICIWGLTGRITWHLLSLLDFI